MQFLIWLLTKIALLYCQWYVGEEKQQTTTRIDTEDVSKPIPATSPIQCVLKCQRSLRRSYFVADKGQCFCLKIEDQKIFLNEKEVSVIFYKPTIVSITN